MFRLIVALGVATILLPAEAVTSIETVQSEGKKLEKVEVSTFDALYAVQSLYSDITSFCDRNAETCNTGKNIANNTVDSIRSTIKTAGVNDTPKPNEQIKTGSVEK